MVTSNCHPNKPHEAFGLCQNCYKRNKYDPAKAKLVNRRSGLKHRRGITLDEFNTMYYKQKGCCKICGNQPAHTLNVDHDHATGKIRGLLCINCNTSLGWYEKQRLNVRRYLGYF